MCKMSYAKSSIYRGTSQPFKEEPTRPSQVTQKTNESG